MHDSFCMNATKLSILVSGSKICHSEAYNFGGCPFINWRNSCFKSIKISDKEKAALSLESQVEN